jgi:hypothetical protein
MGGYTKVDDFPSPMADHKPDVQQAKPDRWNVDEVHRSDAVFVVSEKRFPALALIVVGISLR